jgi:hypothetical protein
MAKSEHRRNGKARARGKTRLHQFRLPDEICEIPETPIAVALAAALRSEESYPVEVDPLLDILTLAVTAAIVADAAEKRGSLPAMNSAVCPDLLALHEGFTSLPEPAEEHQAERIETVNRLIAEGSIRRHWAGWARPSLDKKHSTGCATVSWDAPKPP